MLNYTTNKNIVIEARENCRVPVPVERCPLFKREQQTDEQKDQNCKWCKREKMWGENFILFSFVDFQVYKSDADLNQLSCSKHISDAVQLNWSLLATEIKGTASLRGITLSSTMLSLITVAPLKWGKHFDLNFQTDNLPFTFNVLNKMNIFRRCYDPRQRDASNIRNFVYNWRKHSI